MKSILILLSLALSLSAFSQNSESTLKDVLLEEFKTTYNVKDWFVPLSVALEGVTAEQANWKDATGNHSVGQLASHILFWNERVLKQLKNEPVAEFSGNNEESFTAFEKDEWEKLVKRIDSMMGDFQKLIENATEDQVREWAGTLTHVSTHNAYHTGQIVVVRKLQGSWDADKGVK